MCLCMLFCVYTEVYCSFSTYHVYTENIDVSLPMHMSTQAWTFESANCPMQVLEEATAIDDRAAAGESITPLCGLPLVSCSAYV